MDWETATKELQKPLDPRHVKPPPQGKYGEYVDAHHVISEANRIFGHDGWAYETVSITLTNATKDGDKHRVGYMAIVGVSAGGVHRSDVGHGQGFGKSEGDAHDSAVKEAVTDALKRALRTFGNTFGLALYDKTKADVKAPERTSVELRDGMKSALEDAENLGKLDRIWQFPKFKADFGKLIAPHQNEIIKVYTDRKAALS